MSKKLSIVALAGMPNAGKSTLTNLLVGQKISIVTPKVQTTRFNTRGIVNLRETQIIFIDTPGLFKPKKPLEKQIVRSAWDGINEVDIICFLIDPNSDFLEYLLTIKERVKNNNQICIAVINKIDKLRDKKTLLPIMESLNQLSIFHSIFMISALRGNGIDNLLSFITQNAKEMPWLFKEDEVTDKTEREIAEEVTRETLYMTLAEELPYSIEVKTEKWEELDDGSAKIHQVIHVLKESQKNIIVGKQGAKIKEVGSKSRVKISNILDRPIHLFLYVKVKEDWIEKQCLL